MPIATSSTRSPIDLMSTQTDLFVEFDYGHDVRALIRYPLLAVNDENVDPTVSRYSLWRNGWVHLVIAVTTSLKPEPAVSATCPKEPCVRVVGLAWGPRRCL